MTASMRAALEEAEARGLIKDATDRAGLAAAEGPVAAYAGFDPTGWSLHVGHLAPIMLLRLLTRHGHPTIALVGGATARIGDPSDKMSARPMLAADALQTNALRICAQLGQTLGSGTEIVDNAEWLGETDLLSFLRDVGVHFPLARMLSAEGVARRLQANKPMSFLEFAYPLLQAADFRHLARTRGCRLQIGGSDQWGNICAGLDLVRRTEGIEAFGLTQPLVTTATGAKMGKTADGAVWLDAGLTSDHDFFQFWRNVPDADVGRFLRLFTELDLDEITRLADFQGAALNPAKKRLAWEVTAFVRGRAAADAALRTAEAAFEKNAVDADLPTLEMTSEFAAEGVTLSMLLHAGGLAPSRSAARRLIAQGGARLDGEKVLDPDATVAPDRLIRGVVVGAGKKRRIKAVATG